MLHQLKKILKKPYSKIIAPLLFPGSKDYWETRYASGDNSGLGSYGELAKFKAEIINGFIDEESINSVVEFGCGDGNQLTMANYPRYVGYDVSSSAIKICKDKFLNNKNFEFYTLNEYKKEKFDLALSLDVIYHLVEDSVFEDHMKVLFSSSTRFVIIYSSDSDEFPPKASHIQPRKFSNWIVQNNPEWTQYRFIPNKYPFNVEDSSGSPADFYIFKKNAFV